MASVVKHEGEVLRWVVGILTARYPSEYSVSVFKQMYFVATCEEISDVCVRADGNRRALRAAYLVPDISILNTSS